MFVGLPTDRQADGDCRKLRLAAGRDGIRPSGRTTLGLDSLDGQRNRQGIRRVPMPIAGGGPIRRWAEALRRLSTPGNRLDNVAHKETRYSVLENALEFDQKQINQRKSSLYVASRLFASIRERRRRSEQQSYEEGALLRRRLQELLDVPVVQQNGEMSPSTQNVKASP